PLRKKIMQLETRLEKLTEALNSIETQLGDSALYDARQKAKLSELLADQIKTKSELGDVEMGWMDAQEELEVLTQALNNASGTE
ncbi:MAG: ABC transporter ATP-binding protein, partial [Plesiomonas sp.]